MSFTATERSVANRTQFTGSFIIIRGDDMKHINLNNDSSESKENQKPESNSSKSSELITFHDMIMDESEPPEPIIGDGVLLDNTLLMIVGSKKAQKSFLAMNFSIAIANGQGFAGFDVLEPKKVLHLCFEGGYFPNRKRVKRMASSMDIEKSKNITYLKKAHLCIDNDDDFDRLRGYVMESDCDVLVLDPLAKMHLQDENSSNAMALVFMRIRKLMDEFNISVILSHHTGKNPYQGARGSSFIGGEYDSCITMSKSSDKTKLEFEFRHVETPKPRYIKFNQDTFWFYELADEHTLVRTLEEVGRMKRSEFVQLLEDNDILQKSQSYQLIKAAIIGGEIIEEGKYIKIA